MISEPKTHLDKILRKSLKNSKSFILIIVFIYKENYILKCMVDIEFNALISLTLKLVVVALLLPLQT